MGDSQTSALPSYYLLCLTLLLLFFTCITHSHTPCLHFVKLQLLQSSDLEVLCIPTLTHSERRAKYTRTLSQNMMLSPTLVSNDAIFLNCLGFKEPVIRILFSVCVYVRGNYVIWQLQKGLKSYTLTFKSKLRGSSRLPLATTDLFSNKEHSKIKL